MQIPCRWVNPLINQYIDRELNPIKSVILRKHLKGCDQCKREVLKARNLKNLVKDIQSFIIPEESLRSTIQRRIEAEVVQYRKRSWVLRPVFSWGFATIAVVIAMLTYLTVSKPRAIACDLVVSIRQDTGEVRNHINSSDFSTLLSLSPRETRVLFPSALTLYNLTDCHGNGAIVAQMTIQKNGEVVAYHHGKEGVIKPLFPSGVRLEATGVEGKTLYIGDFKDYRLVCMKKADGNLIAILLQYEKKV